MIQAPQNYYQPQAPAPAAAQKPQSQYNAVKIDIIEPKVNAGETQASPYYMPQTSVYNMPQASVYTPTQAVTAPVQPAYSVPVQTAAPVYAQPAPQIVNQQNISQPQPAVAAPVQQQPAPVVQPQAEPVATAQAEAVPPAPAAEPVSTVDVAGLTSKIKSEDPEAAGKAIEDVALIAQNNPAEAVQLLDTNLMEGLLGVIAKDTSSLQGPTPKQIELRQQIMSGKNLSEADTAEAKTVTPLEMAERNKQYALFTVAILQNLLINEFKKTNNTTPDIKDLPGMEQIVTTIKDNPNPMLRASGLAALAYNARPEYKPVMKEIFELSKNDADENVQKVATEGLSKLDQIK